MNKMYINIGDWGSYGHGKCEKFLLESNKTHSEVSQLFKKVNKKVVDLNTFLHDYDNFRVPHEKWKPMIKVLQNYSKQVTCNKAKENAITLIKESAVGDVLLYVDEFTLLVCALLSYVDKNLIIYVADEDIPYLNSRGNEQILGYGFFE